MELSRPVASNLSGLVTGGSSSNGSNGMVLHRCVCITFTNEVLLTHSCSPATSVDQFQIWPALDHGPWVGDPCSRHLTVDLGIIQHIVKKWRIRKGLIQPLQHNCFLRWSKSSYWTWLKTDYGITPNHVLNFKL